MCMARQVHPECPNQLKKAYLNATKRPHSYLVLDLAQDTHDRLRFRTHIFLEEYPPTFYVDVTDDETDKIELPRSSSTHIRTAKLRKAIIVNGYRELFNSISECVLNVLNGILRVSDCAKRKLSKHR
jgi:hypothetical protein